MESLPSPAHVARLYATAQELSSSSNAPEILRVSFPGIVVVAEAFGVSVDGSLIEWAEEFDTAAMMALISKVSSPFEVAKGVREVVARRERSLPLLAYLVAEERLRMDAAATSGYLRSTGASLESIYPQLVERLGEAFLDAAFEATWKRRAVFRRALDAAGTYLNYVRQQAELTGKPARRGIQTRLGISTVLAARFGPVKEEALRGARKMLLAAHEQGSEHALTYFIEASTWLYDLFDDDESIREAARHLSADDGLDTARGLAAAHIWLRLAGSASSGAGRKGFLREGLNIVETLAKESNTGRKEESAAILLLHAMFKSIERQAQAGYSELSTRGILFPFGLRRPDTGMPTSFTRALPSLIGSLDDSDLGGDYVFRDLQAELHAYLARRPETSKSDAESSLRAAIQLREGRAPYQRALTRTGVEIDLAEDRFLLADITGSTEQRRSGVRGLLGPTSGPTPSPRHLTVLAREVDIRGPLPGAVLEGPDDLVLAIRSGDSAALFEAAARAAYQSADLTQVRLGGRSGVVSLRDSDGAAGQTFVFKQMSPEARERDRRFTQQVSMKLSALRLEHRFGLIEHLTELEPPTDEGAQNGRIVSVRRYRSGAILGEHLRLQSNENVAETLENAAEFLALIHWAGLKGRDIIHVRRDLREKELGRWLRAIVSDDNDRAVLFDLWWEVVNASPLQPRRDAHPMNWLIESDGRLLAVDLESTGARPFGYEVAQLVEDGQVLDPSNWGARDGILDRYCATWSRLSGVRVSETDARHYYEAGALARGIRAISQPSAPSAMRAYGGKLIEEIARITTDQKIRQIAATLSRKWTELTGNVGEEDFQVLSDAARRRISRAMSYHLRHDKNAPATKDGWVHVDELAELLRASGHKVTSQQLILIAGALGEPRFELDAQDIRAVYGHSTRTEIEYSPKRGPQVLYHATPLSNLASIFEARAGLVRGRRNWVHLTDSCAVAVNAAQRQHSPVAVLEVDAANVEGLVYATGSTWLAPAVGVECLRFLPLREVSDLVRNDEVASTD